MKSKNYAYKLKFFEHDQQDLKTDPAFDICNSEEILFEIKPLISKSKFSSEES